MNMGGNGGMRVDKQHAFDATTKGGVYSKLAKYTHCSIYLPVSVRASAVPHFTPIQTCKPKVNFTFMNYDVFFYPNQVRIYEFPSILRYSFWGKKLAPLLKVGMKN